MKLRLEVDGRDYTLDWNASGGQAGYTLTGEHTSSGQAAVTEVMPGVFSVLFGTRSFTVHLSPSPNSTADGKGVEAFAAGHRLQILLYDPRDRSGRADKAGHSGPVELRAQMPGKVIKVLVDIGAAVEAGQGLVVVEAMKMQNELKAPKAGIVSKINAIEGATVAAGESLVIVE